jgi:hypothetical protein
MLAARESSRDAGLAKSFGGDTQQRVHFSLEEIQAALDAMAEEQ